jgi:nucleoside-diphosphate-sugar epimerase/glycosyltransferase involved in cell wall biosynthesis
MLKDKILQLEGPIFIFGASGFIGANLIKSILEYRDDCFAISHNPKNAWRLKLLNTPVNNIIYCDISNKVSVDIIFQKYKPKTVFNLSAYGAYSKQTNINLIYQTNLIGTLNVLENCNDIKVYIHAGSSSEYGLNSKSPDEKDNLEPNSHYALSKVSTSYILQYYAKFKNLLCANLRLYSIYGPWEEPDRLVPKLIELGFKKKYPPLVNPNTTRDFVYIDDCVEAFLDAANNLTKNNSGVSINIGSGIKTSLSEIVYKVKNLFNIDSEPHWGNMKNRSWDTNDWYGNYEFAKEIISWSPKTNLNDGLTKLKVWQEEIDYQNTVIKSFEFPSLISKITAIIACYKDEQAIPIMYKRLVDTFHKIGCDYEIIFVNDNSPDNSAEILHELCLNDFKVITIKHSRNFGSQAAFVSGMELASGDAVVLLDGDLQDPPEMIIDFYDKWKEGFQVVYGRRISRNAPWYMNLAYKTFYRIFSKMSSIVIPKDAGDFSLIDIKVVKHLVSLPEKEQFLRGLRAWVGFKQIGVNYIRPERMFGISTNNFRKNIWWAKKGIFSFTYLPLEIMSYIGFSLTLISFILIVAQILNKILNPNLPHGVPTIIILILFFGGIQLFAISIIGEYLSKVLDEVKGRPKFIRDEVIIKGKKQ